MATPKQATDSETRETGAPPSTGKLRTSRGARAKPANGRKPAKRRDNGLLDRGRAALGEAYGWAGEAGSAVPRAVKHMQVPSRKTLQAIVDERPLLLGAVGLGLGVIIGAILPSLHGDGGAHRGRRNGR